MHELPVTEEILKVVLKHAQRNNVQRVVSINLQIGKLSDLADEWIQRYFDHLSKGTVAEGAKLKIERIPIKMQCNSCSQSYEVEMAGLENLVCPHCGEEGASLLSGREYGDQWGHVLKYKFFQIALCFLLEVKKGSSLCLAHGIF